MSKDDIFIMILVAISVVSGGVFIINLITALS